MMNDDETKSVPRDKQLSGSSADGGIPFRVWDRNAQDQLREIGGEIMVDHYMGKELTMPMFCAPISSFSWQDNQCHETLRWEDDPEQDADGNPIAYDEVTNPRWMATTKQKEWMEFIAEVSTKSATKTNVAPPKWTASYCSLAWQSQLANNRDEAVKNYCKRYTRKVART